MGIEDKLMSELKKEWSKKGNTERHVYLSDVDFRYISQKVQKKIEKFEAILLLEDISLDSYLKAVRECLILCRLLETLKMGKQAAKICPLDKEEYSMYKQLLLNDN